MDQVPDNEWAMMTNLIDSNQDGKMTIGEYQDFSTKQQATIGDKEAQLDMGLKALDLNHNGNLDRVDNNKILIFFHTLYNQKHL